MNDQNANNQSGDMPDPVTAEAYGLMKEKGVYLNDDDPETRTVKQDGTIKQFLDSVEKAVGAKAARVSQKKAVPEPGDDLIEALRGKLPLGDAQELLAELQQKIEIAQGEAAEKIHQKSKEPLREAYRKELAKIRRGDTWPITQLQAKYKRLGLNDF